MGGANRHPHIIRRGLRGGDPLERENDRLYTSLLDRIGDPAVRRVLTRMWNVSLISHQPSFKEYLEFARFGENRAINF